MYIYNYIICVRKRLQRYEIFLFHHKKTQKKQLIFAVFLHNSIIIANFAAQIERLVLINKDSLQ